jgi:hypothetical protein
VSELVHSAVEGSAHHLDAHGVRDDGASRVVRGVDHRAHHVRRRHRPAGPTGFEGELDDVDARGAQASHGRTCLVR